MFSVCQTEIVYRVPIRLGDDKPNNLLAFREFSDLLIRYGWCTQDGTFTKNFRMTNYIEPDYIEWRGLVMD